MDISIGSIVLYGVIIVGAILGVSFIISCIVTTEQQTKRVIERFGKFTGVRSAGMSSKLGWFDRASAPISLRTQQLNVEELSYTDKGTSVTIGAQVQYKVGENDTDVQNAHYKLSNPEAQIKSHVSSAIRGKVPTMSLESVQNNQKSIADAIKAELAATMQGYGYVIEDVLITKADPDPAVVKANNDKYASEQAKTTAINVAEAQATKVKRAAEAERDAAKAHGEGIAQELQAITDGRVKAIATLRETCPNATDHELLAGALFQQYVDGMVKVASSVAPGTKVVFFDGSPDAAHNVLSKLTNTLVASAEAGKDTAAPAATTEAQ